MIKIKLDNEVRKARYKELRELGYTREEAQRIRGWNSNNYNKEVKKAKRRIDLQNKRKLLKELGYDSKDINKLQHRGKSFFETLKDNAKQLYLISFYKDITDNTDAEYFYTYKRIAGRMSQETLIDNINYAIKIPVGVGELGNYSIMVVKKEQVQNAISLKNKEGYLKAYGGYGEKLKSILAHLNIMMSCLYEPWRKWSYIYDFVEHLKNLDNKKAKDNALLLEKLFL
ncbi:TPA: hypothetical protein KPK59_003673 [Clostridioides difficile]|nr:hypothetical protein [Clostridioides difficile]